MVKSPFDHDVAQIFKLKINQVRDRLFLKTVE